MKVRYRFWPKCVTGKTFCERYEDIQDAKHKLEQDRLKAHPAESTIEVSDKAQKIVDYLREEYKWPKGSSSQLPNLVQTSLDYLNVLIQRCQFLSDHDDRKLRDRVSQLRDNLGSPVSFTTNWFKQLHGEMSKWKEWSGDLKPFSISRSCKKLDGLIRGWLVSVVTYDTFFQVIDQ